MPQTFPYRIGRWSRYLLVPFGVRAGHREVVVDDDRLLSRIRLGHDRDPALRTSSAGTSPGRTTGSGPSASATPCSSQDISFCGDASGAVRLHLKAERQVASSGACKQVYLGVEDLRGLAAHLTAQGIPGEDLRTAA